DKLVACHNFHLRGTSHLKRQTTKDRRYDDREKVNSHQSIIIKRLKFVLKATAVCALVAAVAGYTFERGAERKAQKRCPMKGQLVDLGGHRIHLNCIGK